MNPESNLIDWLIELVQDEKDKAVFRMQDGHSHSYEAIGTLTDDLLKYHLNRMNSNLEQIRSLEVAKNPKVKSLLEIIGSYPAGIMQMNRNQALLTYLESNKDECAFQKLKSELHVNAIDMDRYDADSLFHRLEFNQKIVHSMLVVAVGAAAVVAFVAGSYLFPVMPLLGLALAGLCVLLFGIMVGLVIAGYRIFEENNPLIQIFHWAADYSPSHPVRVDGEKFDITAPKSTNETASWYGRLFRPTRAKMDRALDEMSAELRENQLEIGLNA